MKYGVLQVTTPDGRRRDLPLELPSLVVGRADGNDLVIDDLSVSRRHARLVVDSGRLLIEDLNSSNGTFINGVRIEGGGSNLVEDGAELRFGDIVARFVPPPPTDLNADDDEGEDLSISSRIGLTLTTPRALVYAGAPWDAELVVHNRSSVVDRVRLSVPDLPDDWVRFDKSEFSLQSGASAVVRVTIIPPRKAESLAGDYDFTVQVTSQEHQREASVAAKFVLAPFRNLALSFEAARSKRDFIVVAENKGNEAATYTLAGEDPDGAWKFDFELPAVNLQPGEKRTVGLRVTRQRQLMGIAIAMPFNVIAESTTDEEDRVMALGQLAVNPPLQKFRAPAMFVVAAVVIAAVAVGIMLIRSDEVVKTANAEDAYDGVHLCDPEAKAKADERAKEEEAKQQAPGGASTFTSGQNSGAPYFAQNDPRWGKDEYARAKDPEFGPDWCGSTIEQCGCAMTSVATTMALFGLLTMPDGSALTPQSLNNWFNADATKTNRGWVSRGYIYGDVIWTAANQLSGEMAQKNPGSPTIRFSRTGSGSDDEIKEQLRMNRPIILEVPGHWIAAVGLDGDQILINDPFYRDRKTLDVYKGKVKSSVLFEPSQDLSAVVFTAPADVRVRITDKQGRVVGTLATGSAEDAEKGAAVEIPGASYSSRQAWRDPSCIESAPPADAGTNQIILPGSADDYKVEVLDAGGKPTSIAIHTYDRNGKSSVQTIDNPGSAVAQVAVGDGKSDVKVIAGAQPTVPAPTTDAGGGGGADDRTVGPTTTPTRIPTPTATPEPIVETGISIATIPGDNFVAIQSQDGFAVGDEIIFSPGKANEEENRIIGFGSFILEFPLKFAHSPGEVIRKKPRPPGSAAVPTRPLPTPVVLPPLTAPESLVLGCSAVYVSEPKEATLICTLDVTGTFTTTRWSLNGKAVDDLNNQQLLLMSFNSDGNAAVGVSVCNRTICKSTSYSQRISFPETGTSGPGITGGTTGGTGGTALPTATPPASGVVVTCTSQFEQGANPRAEVTCAALFSGPSTSVSWSAPGGQPGAGQGKTFTTYVPPGGTSKLRITATVCNFASCQTSPTVDVGIGSSTTKIFLKNNPITNLPTVPLNSTTTFTAIVSGPVPPAGGTVQFNDGLVPLGPSVPLFTAGAVGFAQMTLVTGTSPLVGENSVHPINAVYSGGTNLFGSFSPNAELTLLPPVPEVCNGIDDDTDIGIDNGCDLALPRDIGGGTIVQSVNLSSPPPGLVTGNNSGDIVVRPGTPVTVNTNLIRFPDCPNCIRQVYLGVAPNTVSGHGGVAPVCVFTGGLGVLPPGTASAPWTFAAPSAPGIYYVRASSTLDFSCLQNPPLGPPDMTIARVVVSAAMTTTLAVESESLPVTGVDDGKEVTVTVSVSPVPPQPGAIRLFDNGVQVGNDAPLDSSGQAAFTFTPTSAGSHMLRARYFGYPAGPVFAQQWYETTTGPGGNEQEFDLAVRTDSTTVLALSVGGAPTSSVTVGTTVTANVTVTPDITFPMAGSPVSIKAGTTKIPTTPEIPVLNANGEVTFTFVAGDEGLATVGGSPYGITATFAGATYVAESTSSRQNLSVTRTNSTTTLAVAQNPLIAGDTLELTATVSGGLCASPLGGSVTFKAGTVVLGSTSIPGIQPANCTTGPNSPTATASLTFVTDHAPIDRTGTYAITAEFDGTNTNLNDSTSAATNLTVTAAPVTVTVTPSAAIVEAGGAGTLTITVVPSEAGRAPGAVTGTVTLSGFTTPAGVPLTLTLTNPPSSKDGVATFNTNQINAGTYTNIVAHYDPEVFGGGSTKYSAADSGPALLTVNKATPGVTLTAPGNWQLGDDVTLTATMTDDDGILQPDGGTVVFFADDLPLCGELAQPACPILGDGGTATLSGIRSDDPLKPLGTARGWIIQARYGGNVNLEPANSANGTLNMATATPNVSLAITPSTNETIGATITFTATLTAGSDRPIPTAGTVTFWLGAVEIGTATVSAGTASIVHLTGNVTTPSPFGEGKAYPDIKAVFNGNAAVAVGESAVATLTLAKATTTATLSPIAAIGFGQSTSFAVTVTVPAPFLVQGPAGGATVQFRKDGANIGTAVPVAADGTASFTANSNATDPFFADVGTFAITAVYSGTTQLAADTSNSQNFVIGPAPSVVTVTPSAAAFTVGGAGTIRALITPGPDGGPGNITGTVTFTAERNGTPLTLASNVTVVSLGGGNKSGEAIINISGFNAGAYTNLVATYSGNSKYNGGASAPGAFDINKATPVVTLTPPAAFELGDNITLTATMANVDGVLEPDGGDIAFFANAQPLCSLGLSRICPQVANGTATLSGIPSGDVPLDTVAGYVIVARYSGNTNLNAVDSLPGTLNIGKATPTVSLSIATSPATIGATVTFTANVVAGRDTRVSTVTGGSVSFFAGANPIATNVALTGDATGATATTSFVTGAFPFDVGGWTYNDIKAVYNTSPNVKTGESALASLTLNKAATTTTLAAITGVTLGQSATFNVTIATTSGFNVNQDGTPPANATVQFRKNGANIGSPVTVSGGGASLTVNTGAGTDFTTAGSFNIDAVYTGTSKLAGSTSAAQALVVAKASSNTSLTLPSLPMTVGESKVLTAAVTGSGTVGTVTGTVTFFDGPTSLGSATVSGGQATLNISTLGAGTYTGLIATYNGDTKYDTSTSSPAQSLTIVKATPTVTLANPGTHTIGTSVTFSATVSSPNGISPVGGTVTFKAGTNTITTALVGAGGVASASVTTGSSPLDTGGVTYNDITAVFEGTGDLNTVTSANGTLILNKAAATVTVSDRTTVAMGTQVVFTATVTASNANAVIGNGVATVTFTMPGGYTDTVTLNAGTASVTLTGGTAPIAAEGSYTITATYNGSSHVSTGNASDTFTVVKATPTVAVVNNGPVTVGSSVTLSATVSATGVSTDGGVVTFSTSGGTIGTSTVGGAISANCGGGTNSIGQAICVAGTGSGQVMDAAKNSPFTVTAAYAGTTQVSTGTATTSVALNRSGPTVSFTGGTGSVALGSSVTFVVNVSGNCGGGNTTTCPNGGTVDLFVGSMTSPRLQRVTLVNNTASFTAIVTGSGSFANAGSYTMIARFNGDDTNGNLAVADVSGTLTLNPVAPTVTLASNSGVTGSTTKTFSFTATISPNFSPTGNVVFKDGATTIGTVALSGNTATLNNITFAATGTHNITAEYVGAGNYTGTDVSNTVVITIT